MFDDDDEDILPLYQDVNPPIYEYLDKRLSYGRNKYIIDDDYFFKMQRYLLQGKKFKIIPTYNFYFRMPRPCHIGIACPIFYYTYYYDCMKGDKCYFKTHVDYKNVKWFINPRTLNITWYSTNFISDTITYNYKLGIDFMYELMEDKTWKAPIIDLPWFDYNYFYNEQEIEGVNIEIKEDDDEMSKNIFKNINTLFI